MLKTILVIFRTFQVCLFKNLGTFRSSLRNTEKSRNQNIRAILIFSVTRLESCQPWHPRLSDWPQL